MVDRPGRSRTASMILPHHKTLCPEEKWLSNQKIRARQGVTIEQRKNRIGMSRFVNILKPIK
jgi:hypothetical protein